MSPAGLETTILANERLKTHALDRAASGTAKLNSYLIPAAHKPFSELHGRSENRLWYLFSSNPRSVIEQGFRCVETVIPEACIARYA